jgi:phosphoribosyl 1,2-cyclic phosphate phosphodiesterase
VSGELEVIILGCGSSGGVPRADGNWGVCDPDEPKNRRSRCSLLVRRPGATAEDSTTVLIDTSPDLQRQTSVAGVKRVDAVLYTHDHADQCHGIDDLRAFAIRQRARIPTWMDAATWATLSRRFDYIYVSQGGYPAICEHRPLPPLGTGFQISGPSGALPVTTFDQDHGGVRSVGYRIGPVAYSSDVLDLPESAFAALSGVKLWIVDALRWTPHPTHSHVEKTLGWIERVRPERAVLTNLHIDLDYRELSAFVPQGVEVAYDGWTTRLAL